MININTVPELELDSMYNSLHKYVKQYLTSGRLKSLFDYFETDEIRHGVGYEINIVFSATAYSGTGRAPEHGTYAPNIMTVIVSSPWKKQYAVTIDEERLLMCSKDDAKMREYAGELVDSLYQGEIDDKNTAIWTEIAKLGNIVSTATVADGTAQEIAEGFIAAMQTKVADFSEGVLASSYGNSYAPATKRIAAEKIAIIMSNATKATLNVYGLSKALSDEFLKVNNAKFISTARMPDNKIYITDVRNIQVHRVYGVAKQLPNSDLSRNEFWNTKYDIQGLFGGDGNNIPVFPAVVISVAENTPEEEAAAAQEEN